MSSRVGKAEFEKLVGVAGLAYGRWAPGDGMTRYRFFEGGAGGIHEHFDGGDGIYTALGSGEALAFLRGYIAGRQRSGNLDRPRMDEPSRYRGYLIRPDPESTGYYEIVRAHSGQVVQGRVQSVAYAMKVIDAMLGD